jgi:hypothetical protein
VTVNAVYAEDVPAQTGRRTIIKRVLPLAGPPVLAAATMVCALAVQSAAYHYQHASDFIQIGRQFAAPFGISYLSTSPVGYDAQYSYYIARFPGQLPVGGYDDPALRCSRMLYPLLIRLAALGHVRVLPWAMLGLDVAAISATVLLLGGLLRARGLSPWWALVVGLYCGQALALLRALGDPLAICFLALALVCVARQEWLGAGAALGLGMLTRESTLLFVGCLALPLVLVRRWGRLMAYGALAMGPYALWEVLLHAWIGQWGWSETAHANTFLPIPFAGLAAAPSLHVLLQMVLFACVPAVAGIVYGLLSLAERPPWVAARCDPLRLGVALCAVAYGVAMLFQPGVHWLDVWEPFRLAAPLALLLPLLSSGAAPKAAKPVWYGLLCLMLYSVTLVLTV